MPSSSSTNAPKFVMRTTLPSIVSPTWCREKKSSQMSVASCLRPSDSRWFSAPMLSTIASTTSPFFSTSEGCLIRVLNDLDERAELGEVAHLPLDARADRVLLGQLVPRVGLDLLEAERDAPRRGIDAEHHRVDGVADVENLRRVLDALAPRHLRDVDETFDTCLELDERAVVGEAHHLAAHARADRVAVLDGRPRILHELLVAERDAFG